MPERTSTSCSTNPSPKKAWKPNMYVADDDEAMDLFFAQDHHGSQPQTPDPDEEAGLRDVRVSNPWVIAKVHASIRPYQNQRHNSGQLLTPIQPNTDPEGGSSASPATVTSDANPSPRILLTPQQSHRESSDPGTASSSPERFPYPLTARNSRSGEHALKAQRAANRERYGGALDTWVRKSINVHSDTPSSTPDREESLSIDLGTGNTRNRDFVSARTLPTGTLLSEIPTAPTRVRRQSPQKQTGSSINKPFTSPLTNDRVWFDVGQKRKGKPSQSDRSQSTLTPQARLQPSSPNTTTSSPEHPFHPDRASSLQPSSPNTASSSPEHPIHPDLASSLDYELRKTLATQQHRATLLRQQRHQHEADTHPINHTSSSTSPHQNRYNKAIAALHHQASDAPTTDNPPSPPQPSASGFDPTDPRHYLLRVLEREHASPSRLPSAKRRKTSRLPLETIPSDQSVRDLVLPIKPLDLKLLAAEVKAMGAWDGYIASSTRGRGGLEAGMGMEIARRWEEVVGGLVGRGFSGGEGEGAGEGAAGLRLEVWPLLQEHARRYCPRGEVEGDVESV